MKLEIEAENEFALYIEFNGVARAELTLFLVREIVRIAKLKRHFGPDAIVEIVEMGRGSFWAKVAIGFAIASGAVDVGNFALDIADRLTGTEERLAQCTAQLVLEGGAASVKMLTCKGTIEVLRDDIPAVRTFLSANNAPPDNVTHWQDFFGNPPRTLPDISPTESVRVTRTTGRYPTVGDRPVELIDGSVVFGSRDVPRSNVRFIEPNDEVAASRKGMTGSVQLFGRFILAGPSKKGILFRTGDALFDVELPEKGVPSIDVPTLARVHLDPRRPDRIKLISWDVIEP